MKKELQERIMNECPLLFNKQEQLEGLDNYAIYRYGIECDDGWYDLIYKLCINIEEHLNVLTLSERKEFKVLQIKEKFAGLRFYMLAEDPYTDCLIEDIQEKSYNICESCGKPGEQRIWKERIYYTSCEDCVKL